MLKSDAYRKRFILIFIKVVKNGNMFCYLILIRIFFSFCLFLFCFSVLRTELEVSSVVGKCYIPSPTTFIFIWQKENLCLEMLKYKINHDFCGSQFFPSSLAHLIKESLTCFRTIVKKSGSHWYTPRT